MPKDLDQCPLCEHTYHNLRMCSYVPWCDDDAHLHPRHVCELICNCWFDRLQYDRKQEQDKEK